jgi:hypothetical protein
VISADSPESDILFPKTVYQTFEALQVSYKVSYKVSNFPAAYPYSHTLSHYDSAFTQTPLQSLLPVSELSHIVHTSHTNQKQTEDTMADDIGTYKLEKTITLNKLKPNKYRLWVVQTEATFDIHKYLGIVLSNETNPGHSVQSVRSCRQQSRRDNVIAPHCTALYRTCSVNTCFLLALQLFFTLQVRQ